MILFGFPTSGKTTLGFLVSYIKSFYLYDTDIVFYNLFNFSTELVFNSVFNERQFRISETFVSFLILFFNFDFLSFGGGAIVYYSVVLISFKINVLCLYIYRYMLFYIRNLFKYISFFKFYNYRLWYYSLYFSVCVFND